MLMDVDRACPKTLPQPLRSPWYYFLSQSYNYFRYTSAILEFMGEGNVGKSRHNTPVKTLPQNRGIATEIASISVSVAKLLLLPVLVDFNFRFVFQILKFNVYCCLCLFQKSVYLSKCGTITSISW